MLLDLLFGRPRASYGDAAWGGAGWTKRSRTVSGVSVNEDNALTLAAVWCCSRIICETESSLPLFTYKRLTTDESSGRAGDTQHAGDYYLYDILRTTPNPTMGSTAWRSAQTLHMANWGNGFSEIEFDSYDPSRRTRVVALWPIHPSRVKPILPRGAYSDLYPQGYRYLVVNNDNSRTPLKADEMLHIPGVLTEDGIWGKSCIAYHRETIGLGMALQAHASATFGGRNIPRGVLNIPGVNNAEKRKEYRQEWKELHGNPDSNEVCILPLEAKFQAITMSNEDSQFIESAKFSNIQIAQIYRVPLYKIAQYEKAASFASVEQSGIDFVVDFLPWLRRWEEQCNLKLILPQDRATYFVEHNVAGLLRGDFGSRMAGYVQALTNGLMTINECRRCENLNSIGPAGDVNFVQMNMTTAQQMLAGPPPVQSARNAGQDGAALTFDQWSQEMLVKQQERLRDEAGLSQQGKATLQLPPPEPRREPPSDAVRLVVADACCRVLTKIGNALGRASGKITSVDEWLTAFVRDHGETLTEMVAPAAGLQGLAAVALLERLTTAARADLSPAFDADTPAQFAGRLAAWPRECGERVAGEIVADNGNTGGEVK